MGDVISAALKTAFIVTVTGVFLTAVISLTSLIVSFGQSTILGEILGVISMCVPFDLNAVIVALMSAFDALIVFQVAKKTWTTVTHGVEAT